MITSHWRQRGYVFAPLVILSLIFGIFVGLLMVTGSFRLSLTSPILIGGVASYSIAVAILAQFGLQHAERLERWGMTDSLSKLPNRRALHAYVRNHASRDEEMAVSIIDLDGFKTVNDQYGHAIGDKLIKECATILADFCGDDAMPFRLGGDEFAICLIAPHAGSLVEGIGRAFIDRCRHPVVIDGRRIPIGASIGITASKGPGRISSGEAMRRSDVAMYVSKERGKGRSTWYKESFDANRETMREFDIEMRAALANEDFNLAYQPLVDAQSGKVVAAEALLRWENREDGPIGPNVFVPIAEQTGLINEIGLWVLRRACKDALAWDDITISVNVSAVQLRDVEFPILLGQILEETGFPAHRLELEVTETCLVSDPDLAKSSLDMIRKFGVNISLDDFGTGYASIGFLRQFRFEKLKLDRSLICDAQSDEGSRAMMVSSITMAQALKMGVTAEGVETEAQADLVRDAGCNQIQGWLYYKALPAAELEATFAAAGKTAPLKLVNA